MAKLITKRKRGRPAKDPRKAKAQVVRIRQNGEEVKRPTIVRRAEVEGWLDQNQAAYDRVVGRKRSGQVTLVEACCEALGITKRTLQRHVVAITKRRQEEAARLIRAEDPMVAAMARAMISKTLGSATAQAAPSATGEIQGSQQIVSQKPKTKNVATRSVGIPLKIDLGSVHQELVRAASDSNDRGLLTELQRAIEGRLAALGQAATTSAKGQNVEQMATVGLVSAIADYLDLAKDSSATGQTVARNLGQIEAWLRGKLPQR